MSDYRKTCIHGVKEDLDSHDCPKCAEIAKELGWHQDGTSYIFTNRAMVNELLRRHKAKEVQEKIPEKVKDEIVRELERMRERAVASMNVCHDGQASWSYDKGRANGLSAAISVINSWNDPEHGKVVARPA